MCNGARDRVVRRRSAYELEPLRATVARGADGDLVEVPKGKWLVPATSVQAINGQTRLVRLNLLTGEEDVRGARVLAIEVKSGRKASAPPGSVRRPPMLPVAGVRRRVTAASTRQWPTTATSVSS